MKTQYQEEFSVEITGGEQASEKPSDSGASRRGLLIVVGIAVGLLVAGMLVFFILGSSSEPVLAEDVAEAFVISLADKDYEKAAEYATPESGTLLNLLATFPGQESRPELDFYGESELTAAGYIKVYYLADGKEQAVFLREMDGEWKVDMLAVE